MYTSRSECCIIDKEVDQKQLQKERVAKARHTITQDRVRHLVSEVWLRLGSVIIEPMVMSAGAAVHREASSLTEPQGLSFRWREAAAWLPCTHSVPDSVPHSCRRGSSSPCWSLSCLGKIFRSRRHFILSGLLLLSDVQPRIPPKVESDVFELSIGLVIIFSTVTMTLEATHPDFS